ncbi:MAG: transglycosylase domain-containing protein [Oscillospiraceae bacterium]
MDENKNKSTEKSDQSGVGSDKHIDDFFAKLDESGALEDTADAKKRSANRYDPDYINLGDYEKSDTGFVSLKDKKSGVEVFDSAASDEAKSGKSGDSAKSKSTKGGKPSKKDEKTNKSKVESEYKKPHTGWRRFGKVVLFLFCIGIISVCVVSVAAAMYLAKVTVNDDEILDLNSIKLSYATRLMAQDTETEEWYEYERIFGDENRVWVDYKEFPQELIDVTVSSEDQRFWQHNGVDIKRTMFAFINEYVFKMSENTQGGSTITQQLIKNITEDKSAGGIDGALRKLREIYRAFMLERKYSKEQILEAYLNTFRLGGQIGGIESAANHYFNKTTKDLTTAESAAIVCITKFPTAYDPFLNPEENKREREDVVLWTMHERGEISDEDYNKALAESATFEFTEPGGNTSESHIYSYFTDTVVREVMRDLQEINGLTEAEAYDLFYNKGGLTVYMTMDPLVQDTVEDVTMNPKYWENDSDERFWPKMEYEYQKDENDEFVLDADGKKIEVLAKNQVQSAMVVLDVNTGELKGVSGGIRTKEGSLCLNRAVDSVRQTGSSMKPIAAYAPALELDKITFSTLFADAPVDVVDGQPWPRNYSRQYGSAVTVYEGLAKSLNTTAASAIKLIGPDYAFDFLSTSLGITSLVDVPGGVTDRTMSLALGGLSYGVSPYEMAGAYQVFANDGTYRTPHCYRKVADSRGNVVLDKEKNIQTIKALSDDTAMIMNRLLQGVVKEGYGTGTAMRYCNTRALGTLKNNKFDLAGKTGTSSEDNDFWAIGMNPYYVMAVWEGYDQKDNLPNLRPHPTQIAFNLVMSRISENKEPKNFPVVDDVVVAQYCPSTGYLASGACPATKTGYYKKDNVPKYCSHEFVPTPEEQAAAAAAAAAAAG